MLIRDVVAYRTQYGERKGYNTGGLRIGHARMTMVSLSVHSCAELSEDRRYRYTLLRWWDDRPLLNMVMLNPSTADEVENDPTVERCERRARTSGYGGLLVTNLFALRSSDPRRLYVTDDPVGPGNDEYLLEAAQGAGMVLCGWGVHGRLLRRGEAVANMLSQSGITLHALHITRADEPGHPLYLKNDQAPFVWREGSRSR